MSDRQQLCFIDRQQKWARVPLYPWLLCCPVSLTPFFFFVFRQSIKLQTYNTTKKCCKMQAFSQNFRVAYVFICHILHTVQTKGKILFNMWNMYLKRSDRHFWLNGGQCYRWRERTRLPVTWLLSLKLSIFPILTNKEFYEKNLSSIILLYIVHYIWSRER